ncbi:hypothetical protein [Chroococcidiopsis sp.]|uniref:hypothetical protein n=1 Tax=Chroococcidiopsis sp. TaxID=3088168 RepID=UPI003F370AFD
MTKLTNANKLTFFQSGIRVNDVYQYSGTLWFSDVKSLAAAAGVEIEARPDRSFKVTYVPLYKETACRVLAEYQHAVPLLRWLLENDLIHEGTDLEGLAIEYAASNDPAVKRFLASLRD